MTYRELVELVSEAVISLPSSTTRKQFARVNCPVCPERVGKEDRKQCMSVNLASGWFGCWRCSAKGRIDLPETLQIILSENERKHTPVRVGPPECFLPLYEEPGISSIAAWEAREYLHIRGLQDMGIWRAAKIGCCITGMQAGRIIIPVIASDGTWYGWVGRAWAKKADRPYFNAPHMSLGSVGGFFNESALYVDTEVPLMVMEGVFDALAYWPDAVAVLGKPTCAQVQALKGAARPVVVVLDGDAWEQCEMLALSLQMEGVQAGWVKLPPQIDPDEVDHNWLRNTAVESLTTV